MKQQNNTGFRLKRFEVRNWGVFTNADLDLQCQNALLTGQNGAGKTTLVDGLVTLLIPTPENFYNQSAGLEEKKKNRTKADYVLGNLGQKEGIEGKSEADELRKREEVITILLGVFYNEPQNRYVSIAHVYWFSDGNTDRPNVKFLVAPNTELSIDTDFTDLDPTNFSTFNKNNKGRIDNYSDNFSQYATAFMKLLHIQEGKTNKKHNALLLFAKTVGIKVLGDVNVFIRDEMLDQPEYQKPFSDFKNIVKELNDTYEEIVVAEKQKEILQPIIEQHNTLTQNIAQEAILTAAQTLIKPYFATQKLSLLEHALDTFIQEQKILEIKKENKETEIKRLQAEEKTLDKQIEGSETGREITRLEREVERLGTDVKRKKGKMAEYNGLATVLKQHTDPDAAMFYAQIKAVEELQKGLLPQIELFENQKYKLQKNLDEKTAFWNGIDTELKSLGTRNTNIPTHLVTYRDKIAHELKIPKQELPFAGELIEVRAIEKPTWERALEKRLNSFAQTILVDAEYIKSVDFYTNQHKSGTLFVHTEASVNSNEPYISNHRKPNPTIIDKVILKEDSPFKNWLYQRFLDNFNDTCLLSTTDFHKYQFAITPEALIKKKDTRRKDDRPETGKSNFVLGWSNEAKKQDLQRQANEIYKEIQSIENNFKLKKDEKRNLEITNTKCMLFLNIKHPSEIIYQDDEEEITGYNEKVSQLRANDKDLDDLREQLKKTKKEKEKVEDDKEKITKKIGSLEENQKDTNKKRTACATILQPILAENWDNEAVRTEWIEENCDDLQTYLPTDETELSNIDTQEKETTQKLGDTVKDINKEIGGLEKSIITQMGIFHNPTGKPEKWADNIAKTMSVQTPDLQHINEYRKKYDTIEKEELPDLRSRFRKKMEDDIQTKAQQFQSSFTDSQEVIKDTIEIINQALQKVYFDDIKLSHLNIQVKDKPKNTNVTTFKADLRALSSDNEFRYANASDTQKEQMRLDDFNRIKKFLDNLDEYSPEKQKEVLDVRNWYAFETKEIPQDGGSVRIIESTGKDSGGEKAKLTYTILMAALVYHFNIADNNEKSFRFIVVDEAFSKLDGKNSTFLLKLCAQLNLQLLCITPLKDLNLVEDYVDSFFLVQKYLDITSQHDKAEAYTISKEKVKVERQKYLDSLPEKP